MNDRRMGLFVVGDNAPPTTYAIPRLRGRGTPESRGARVGSLGPRQRVGLDQLFEAPESIQAGMVSTSACDSAGADPAGIGLPQGADESSLKAALAADQAENHDTDSDGTPDIEALNQGLDPNGNISAAPPPIYGCALTRFHSRRGNNALIAYGVLFICVGFMCRVLRRSRRST
jgi:hypothetical protein